MSEPADIREAEATRLETRVQSCLGARVSWLRIDVQDNGVVLRGHARTYYAKQLAQHAVMTLTRLPILANEIEVSSLPVTSVTG
jgi:hypothetical protein